MPPQKRLLFEIASDNVTNRYYSTRIGHSEGGGEGGTIVHLLLCMKPYN